MRLPYCEVFLFVLVLSVWLNLVSGAHCQDRRTAPIAAPHPGTGEEGTWIPKWLEKQHVLDDFELSTLRKDLDLANKTIAELKLANVELEETIQDMDMALNEASDNLVGCEKEKLDRTRRTSRAALVLAGLVVAVFAASLVL